MTLALYGKTRRRRAGLLLGGLLAIVLAVGGGTLLRGSEDARATPPSPSSDVKIQVHKYIPKDNPPASDNAPWENQGIGQGTFEYTVYADSSGTKGTALPGSPNPFTQLQPSVAFTPQAVWLTETGTNGYDFYGWYLPEDPSSGNPKCNQAPLNFTTAGDYSREADLQILKSFFDVPGDQQGIYHVCAYNKPAPTANVTFVKLMCEAGTQLPAPFVSPNPVSYDPANIPDGCIPKAGWKFDTGTTWSPLGGVTNTFTTGPDGTVTHTMTPAEFESAKTSDAATKGYFVQEEERAGFTRGTLQCYMDYGGVTDNIEQVNFNANPVAANVTCLAYNTSSEAVAREITITKEFDHLGSYEPTAADMPTFTLTGDPFGSGDYIVTDDVHCDLSGFVWTCNVPASWKGTVLETPLDGWQACTAPSTFNGSGNGNAPVSDFTFCNEPYAEVTVIKQHAGDFTGYDWTFTEDLPGAVGPVVGTNNTAVDAYPTTKVAPGTYHVAEIEGVSFQDGCFGDEAPGYYTEYKVAVDGSTTVAQTDIGNGTVTFSAGIGQQVVVTFVNTNCAVAASPNIIIEKFSDLLGNRTGTTSIAGFQIIVKVDGVQLDGDPVAPGVQPFTSIGAPILISPNPGTVEVTEVLPNAGWLFTGSKTDEGDNGSFEASVAGQPASVVVSYDDVVRFNFYNQPVGQIPVHKDAFTTHNGGPVVPAPQDDDGWTITVTSATCDINRSLVTDNHGDALFINLPLCTDYVVSEGAVNADSPGFVPLSAAQFTNITPNGVTLTFNNILSTFEPFIIVTPVPTPPTATPVPPTATPVAPTNTPTTPSATAIAGEKTPGPGQPTPVVPSTGNTASGPGAGTNTIVIVGALLTLATAFGTTALIRRRR